MACRSSTQAMPTFPVTLYTALDSLRASQRELLRQQSVPYQEIVVDSDVDARAKRRSVPPQCPSGRGTTRIWLQEAAWSLALMRRLSGSIVLRQYRHAPAAHFGKDAADRPAPPSRANS